MKITSTILRNALRHEPQITKLIAEGLTLGQMGVEMGLPPSSVSRYITALALKRSEPLREESFTRDAEVVAMRLAGATLQECSNKFGVTRERIRQIVQRAAPDVVMARHKPASIKTCIMCGAQTRSVRQDGCCSLECSRQHRGINKYDRDWAVQIMELRDHEFTWEEVGTELKTPYIRTRLQRKQFLFSSDEQLKYFPKLEVCQ